MTIRSRIDTYPVVATGARWPHSHEGMGHESPWGKLLERYPFLESDPRYAEFGSCKDEPDNPPPGSPGGGLFPVLCKFPDGMLACAVRTGATHKNTPGAQIGLTISEDRGRTWSPYRVVVRGLPLCLSSAWGPAQQNRLQRSLPSRPFCSSTAPTTSGSQPMPPGEIRPPGTPPRAVGSPFRRGLPRGAGVCEARP